MEEDPVKFKILNPVGSIVESIITYAENLTVVGCREDIIKSLINFPAVVTGILKHNGLTGEFARIALRGKVASLTTPFFSSLTKAQESELL